MRSNSSFNSKEYFDLYCKSKNCNSNRSKNSEIWVIPYYYTLDFKRVLAVGIVILLKGGEVAGVVKVLAAVMQ